MAGPGLETTSYPAAVDVRPHHHDRSRGHNQPVIRAFATAEPLADDDLHAAGPPRYPRPSRLASRCPSARPRRQGRGAARAADGRRPARAPAARPPGRAHDRPARDGGDRDRDRRGALDHEPLRAPRGMKPLVEAVVADATGTMKATFFNQPWLERKYRPGTRLLLQGKYQGRNRFRVSFHAPTGEAVGSGRGDGHLPGDRGAVVDAVLALAADGAARRGDARAVARAPAGARAPARSRRGARAAHFGDHEGGRRRLALEELMLLQIALLRRRARRREGARAEPLEPPGELTRRWLADSLPFTPTDDQRNAMATVDEDLARDRPMQRLLIGEVGSGKTVVALYATLRAVEGGAQAALMAPTETLAEQHFATLQKLMPGELVQAALLTGSTPAARRTDLLGKLATGELRLLVGTHALIERRSSLPASRGAWWTSSTASASISAARCRKAAANLAAPARHDGHADPAHAGADATVTSTYGPRQCLPGASRSQRLAAGEREPRGLRAHPRAGAPGPPGVRGAAGRGV